MSSWDSNFDADKRITIEVLVLDHVKADPARKLRPNSVFKFGAKFGVEKFAGGSYHENGLRADAEAGELGREAAREGDGHEGGEGVGAA